MKLVIRSALTGDILYERDYVAVEELRVWELRQHFRLAIGATAYFAWQLFDDHRLLKDHYFVANVVKDAFVPLFSIAVRRSSTIFWSPCKAVPPLSGCCHPLQ